MVLVDMDALQRELKTEGEMEVEDKIERSRAIEVLRQAASSLYPCGSVYSSTSRVCITKQRSTHPQPFPQTKSFFDPSNGKARTVYARGQNAERERKTPRPIWKQVLSWRCRKRRNIAG